MTLLMTLAWQFITFNARRKRELLARFSAEVRRHSDTTFSFVPRSRYAESVLPLLIVAQRKLQEQINDHGGPSGSQPLITISKETGIAEEFFIKPSEYMSIEPAVHIDPEGHDVYRGSVDALRLVSVPLDVNKSLQALHQALELKHHTARSLDHSRQLLLCYLAGQQEGKRIRYASKCKSRGWNRSDETLLIVMITTASVSICSLPRRDKHPCATRVIPCRVLTEPSETSHRCSTGFNERNVWLCGGCANIYTSTIATGCGNCFLR